MANISEENKTVTQAVADLLKNDRNVRIEADKRAEKKQRLQSEHILGVLNAMDRRLGGMENNTFQQQQLQQQAMLQKEANKLTMQQEMMKKNVEMENICLQEQLQSNKSEYDKAFLNETKRNNTMNFVLGACGLGLVLLGGIVGSSFFKTDKK